MSITYTPIGYFDTPHKDVQGMPIQPSGARGIKGSISILPEYWPAFADLDGFSHVIVLYHFHAVKGFETTVTPFLDNTAHGLFATRTPKRPNPIGLSVMQLVAVRDGKLELENVDVLHGTPVLDVKPYVPDFDVWSVDRIGWMDGKSSGVATHRSDDRFDDRDK